MNYFKSNYNKCVYCKDWYGTYDYSPQATILLYDDDKLVCYGYSEHELNNEVTPMTKEEVENIIDNYKITEYVYTGDKLENRWNVDLEEGDIYGK